MITGHISLGFQHPSTRTAATEERLQPWKTLPEVQDLFKPEMRGALDGNAGERMKGVGEEPLRRHLARHVINTPSTNIGNVDI